MYSERAGFGERLVAYLLDSVIVGLIIGIPTACVGGVAAFMVDLESASGLAIFMGLFFLVILIAAVGSFLYFGRMWSRTGQTVGKKLMGLQVVTADGSLPGFWRAVGRAVIGYGLSSAVFNLGFLWMLWDELQQTWHDKLFGTYVVKV